MYTKLCVLLLAIGMSQAVPQLVMPDLNLMQFMMQTRDLQGNPARSLECFDYYIPILNGYAETYKKEFQQCLDVAAEARLEIDDTTVENRTVINNAANGACEALTECSKLEIATEFFQCYSNQGSSNSKTLYTISANASELLAQVNQEYYLIELSQDACTNKSERAYIENNNAGIEELNKCVSGISPVPTAEPESSTAEPESSSAAPESSTAEPESSSAAPESSTAEPESSSAAPESSSAEPESSSAAPESSSAEPESSSAAPESSSAEPESSSAEPESSSAAPESSSESPESTTADQRENLPEEDLSSRVAQEQAKLEQVLQSMRNWINRQ